MKTCWAQYLLWLVILVLGTGSALSACGQKGDLYLPDAQSSPAKKSPVKKDTSVDSHKEPPS